MKRLLLTSLVISPAVPAAEIRKENNGDYYLLGSSWEGGVVPGPGDIIVWDGNFTHTALPRPYLDGNLSILGIRSTINAAQKVQLDKPGAAAPEVLTTIGAGGISIENFGLGVNLTSNVLLAADQTWTTTGSVPAAGISYLSTLKQGNEGYFDFGGHTVTKNGPAQVSFATNTNGHATLSNGTLIMNGGELHISSSSQFTSTSPVPYMRVASSFTIRLNPTSSLRPFNSHTTQENLLWNARVELNGGTMFGCGAQVIFGDGRSWPGTVGGVIDVQAASYLILPSEINNLTAEHKITASITGSANLSLRNLTASSAQSDHRLILAGDNSGYSGTFLLDGNSGRRSVRMCGNHAGSAAAACTISNLNTLEIEDSTISLGSLAGTGTTAKVNAVGGGTSVLILGARNATTSSAAILANDAGSALTIRKVGTGAQTFTNANSSYTGDTIVESGSLLLNSLLDDNSTVRLSTGAVLRVKPAATDTVALLMIDGVLQPAGTYGATGSTATNQSPLFTGTGILNVTGSGLNPYHGWIHSFAGLDSSSERAEAYDADGDGMTNFAEFVTSGNPVSSSGNPLIRQIMEPGGAVTYILPMTTASYPSLSVQVQASSDLTSFLLPVTEVSPPPGVPALPSLWAYKAWRAPAGENRVFFRTVISP